MFTGIIEATGRVDGLEELEGGRRIRVACPFASALRVDESVAVNGACLTVVAQDDTAFESDAVEETLAKTSLGDLAEGDMLNLERAMPAVGRFDGHLVQGHVDATGTIEEVEKLADSWLVTIAYPDAHGANLIPQGSITVDGISLTIARLISYSLEAGAESTRPRVSQRSERLGETPPFKDDPQGSFTVAIIPHTWENTTARLWQPGRRVNLEFDMIGKYVARILATRA